MNKIIFSIIILIIAGLLIREQILNRIQNSGQTLGEVTLPSPIKSQPTTAQNSVSIPSPTQVLADSAMQSASSASTLKIQDIKIGTGKEAKTGDTILINYTGTLTDGKKFDSSYDTGKPIEVQIGVGNVIKGWDMGVIGMKVGGQRRLIIPPNLGYGPQGIRDVIPPNATLIFDLELVDVK
ncbi:MAG: FKBP-type peptidyl-prolyl cis-trans isomerase [Candidatus Levyibacteriota bacterium]